MNSTEFCSSTDCLYISRPNKKWLCISKNIVEKNNRGIILKITFVFVRIAD